MRSSPARVASVPLVSDVFNRNMSMQRDVRERDFRTSCPTCRSDQRLDQATVDRADDDPEVVYVCRKGCGPILIVGTPGTTPWPGRGYRIRDWVIRNPTKLVLQSPGMTVPVVMDASLHALE